MAPPRAVVERLAAAGCVAAEEEAAEILAVAAGDGARVETMILRREAGEPLAWVVGGADFAGLRLRVTPGVYVPRYETQALALRAADALPERGTAVDLCCGSGAIAAVLAARHPHATIVAVDRDLLACRCAAANGAGTVVCADMAEPLAPALDGRVDVVSAVAPYVPTDHLDYLPRDTLAYEPITALDGGAGGIAVLLRVLEAAGRLLRPGGVLLAEIGAGQDEALAGPLAAAGLASPRLLRDEDGDLRGIEARRG